jgi:hypothetical protein
VLFKVGSLFAGPFNRQSRGQKKRHPLGVAVQLCSSHWNQYIEVPSQKRHTVTSKIYMLFTRREPDSTTLPPRPLKVRLSAAAQTVSRQAGPRCKLAALIMSE